MSVLAFDPGAKRCGWGCLDRDADGSLVLRGYGHLGLLQDGLSFQEYRLEVIQRFCMDAETLLDLYEPDVVVSEILPVVGGGNFVTATQSQLAATAITTIQTVAASRDIPLRQIAANTVKKAVGGKSGASKVAVRNGVFEAFPHIRPAKLGNWVIDVSDAIAVGLTYLQETHGR